MKYEKCRCIKVEISTSEMIYVKLGTQYENILCNMFPYSSIVECIPNIGYEPHGELVDFSWDLDKTYYNSQENIFDIMFAIEDYAMYKFGKMVFHGGAIAYEDKAIIFIQSRKSGKSTLIRALLGCSDYQYVSDDLLLYDNKCVAGVALPIRVRNKLEEIIKVDGKYIGEMIDESGELRHIFVPSSQVHTGYTKIAAIVLPKYQNKLNSIDELKGVDKVSKLLTNIKEYTNMENLYNQIADIANTIPVYSLQYYDTEFAKEEIFKLWKK